MRRWNERGMFAAALVGVVSVRTAHAAAWWQPEVNATWQWQLQYQVNTSFNVDMYDIDLFDVSETTFDELKSRGIAVICYFSAGTREDWRVDANDFPAEALGEPLGDWEGEVWVDISNEGVRDVMSARLDLAAEKGCSGVEPDNVQVYLEQQWTITGLNVTAAQQLDYNTFLAEGAHARNLSIGLKNDLEQMEELEPLFDWAINESCFTYDECDGYLTTFIAANKPVFHTEYEWDSLAFCAKSEAMGMSSLLKSYDLGPERCSCSNPSTNYQCALLLEEGEVPPPSSSSSTASSSETSTPTVAPTSVPTLVPTSSPAVATPAPTVAETLEPGSGAGRRFVVGTEAMLVALLTAGVSAVLGGAYP